MAHESQLRSFPVVYASNVSRSMAFYKRLGFVPYYQLPEAGEPGYVGMRRGDSYLGVTATTVLEDLLGLPVGAGPRFELFTYVASVDETVDAMRLEGVIILREPVDMPWGERLAYVADPDGNPVTLAAPLR